MEAFVTNNKPQTIGFKDEATDHVHEWLQRTTSHGLPNIVRAQNMVIRVGWILFFLASLTYCIYVIIVSLIQYFQYQTTISTSYIGESPTIFPSVTFCNLNPFIEEYALHYMQDRSAYFEEFACVGDITEIDKWADCFYYQTNANTPFNSIEMILKKLKRNIGNSGLTDEQKYNYGFDLGHDMLLNCQFNGEQCDTSSFSKFWHNEYGYCYTFNDGKTDSVRKTSEAGATYGLQLELVVLPPGDTYFAYRSGIYLIVHNQTTVPLSLFGGITVSPGFDTFVGVKRTFITKKESPYSDCIKDLTPFSIYSKKLFGFFKDFNVTTYDQQLCSDFCYQDKLIDRCQCCSTLTEPIRNVRFCETTEQLDCEDEFDTEFSSTDQNKLCDNACREKCEYQKYDLSSSSAFYPNPKYLKYLTYIYTDEYEGRPRLPNVDNELLASFAQKSLIKVAINYDSYQYTYIGENPVITFEQLLGSVGGQLGLFIGISLLSIIECLEIAVELALLYYDRKVRAKFLPQITNVNIVKIPDAFTTA